MNNYKLRDSKVIIKEAELLNASNDFIYSFFLEKSLKYSAEIDEQVEDKLLLKNDDFIDIVLAQYCQYDETIFKLFSKALANDNLSLKLACLSNETVGKYIVGGNSIPCVLFAENRWNDCPLTLNWFKLISNKEIDVLFRNKSIDDDWLTSLLECDNDFWMVLDEDKKLSILSSLSFNIRVKTNYKNTMIDGMGEYDYNNLFTVIWDLSKKLPVSIKWASALESLLHNTVDERYDFDSIEVAKRWVISTDNSTVGTDKFYLNSFEGVRFYLYKNIIKDSYGKDCLNLEHFSNTDIAFRMCAYSKLKNITIDDMNSIVSKDGSLAVNYLLMNENLWMVEETREILKDLCFKLDEENSSGSGLDCINGYLIREKMMEELHPNWFIEKIFDISNEDDKLLNIGNMRELIKELREELTNGIFNLSNAYSKRVTKIELILYAILGVVLVVLFR